MRHHVSAHAARKQHEHHHNPVLRLPPACAIRTASSTAGLKQPGVTSLENDCCQYRQTKPCSWNGSVAEVTCGFQARPTHNLDHFLDLDISATPHRQQAAAAGALEQPLQRRNPLQRRGSFGQ